MSRSLKKNFSKKKFCSSAMASVCPSKDRGQFFEEINFFQKKN